MYVLKQRILQAKARRGKKRRISDKNFWREVRVWEFFVCFLGFASVEKLGFDGKNILFFDAAVFLFFVFLFFLEAVGMERHREFEVLYYRHIHGPVGKREPHIGCVDVFIITTSNSSSSCSCCSCSVPTYSPSFSLFFFFWNWNYS